jgi:hypothetical protein
MLHKVKDLRGDKIAASDGDIGQVEQVYFDDDSWHVIFWPTPDRAARGAKVGKPATTASQPSRLPRSMSARDT